MKSVFEGLKIVDKDENEEMNLDDLIKENENKK
jgi:hypothetical protein